MKYQLNKLTHYLLIFLVFLFFTSIFFWKIIFYDHLLFFGDNLLHIGPNMHFWKQSVLQGQIPLWNPFIFSGVPHLANPATNTLSPFNLVFFLFDDVYLAISFLIIILVSLAGLGMYSFLKSLKLSFYSALTGGILFAFSGSILTDINDLNSLQSVIFIPFILLIVEKFIKKESLNKLTYISILMGLQFVSGHPQYAYYTWLLVGGYYLFYSQKKLIYRFINLTFINSLFIGLVSILLLPFLELSNLTYRPNESSFNSSNSLEVLDLPRFVLGHFYGSWSEGNSWGPKAPLEIGRANTHGFMGIISLSLTFIGLIYSQNKYKYFFGILMLITFIFAMGNTTPLYQLTNFLPLFNKFRTPMRLLILYSFSVAVLASLGIEYVRNNNFVRSKNN